MLQKYEPGKLWKIKEKLGKSQMMTFANRSICFYYMSYVLLVIFFMEDLLLSVPRLYDVE
jgi:hypothetical protein